MNNLDKSTLGTERPEPSPLFLRQFEERTRRLKGDEPLGLVALAVLIYFTALTLCGLLALFPL